MSYNAYPVMYETSPQNAYCSWTCHVDASRRISVVCKLTPYGSPELQWPSQAYHSQVILYEAPGIKHMKSLGRSNAGICELAERVRNIPTKRFERLDTMSSCMVQYALYALCDVTA
jgi:hypothetical protein